jgi:hypothetical protein
MNESIIELLGNVELFELFAGNFYVVRDDLERK